MKDTQKRTDSSLSEDSFGEEFIDKTCPYCGARLLRSYTGREWCSKNFDNETKACALLPQGDSKEIDPRHIC